MLFGRFLIFSFSDVKNLHDEMRLTNCPLVNEEQIIYVFHLLLLSYNYSVKRF